MRKQYSRIAAVVLALTAGGLAAFALKPASGNSAATLAARNPAVEVRTQVIRRTIHVIRHEPGAKLHGSRGRSVLVAAPSSHVRARTAASGGHHSTHSAATGVAVATRASGSHSTGSSPAASQSPPVTTRSSGSHSTASSPAASQSHPVTTRSSGSHGTSSGPGSAGSSGHPVTRSSGGGHGHGDDGGNDGGGDN